MTTMTTSKFLLAPLLLTFCLAGHAAAQMADEGVYPDRRVLPLTEPYRKPITALDARTVKAPPVFQVEAPKGIRMWSSS